MPKKKKSKNKGQQIVKQILRLSALDRLGELTQIGEVGKRLLEGRFLKVGTPPGSLVYTGEKPTAPAIFHLFRYDQETVEQFATREFDAVAETLDTAEDQTVWIDLEGLHDVEHVRKVGERVGLNTLLLEDALDVMHPPKAEEYDAGLFAILKMIDCDIANDAILNEQLVVVLHGDTVLTLQEGKEGDAFDPLRQRLANSLGKTRKRKADYLFYSVIDAVVDRYYLALDYLGAKAETLEEDLTAGRHVPDAVERIVKLKKQAAKLRRYVVPLRETLHMLLRKRPAFLQEETYTHFADVQDHLNHLASEITALREQTNSLTDLNANNLSIRMNRVMQTLTVISTVFIPLTFIAGVYGMNFKNMPELEHPQGYPFALLAMGGIGLATFLYMRMKQWF